MNILNSTPGSYFLFISLSLLLVSGCDSSETNEEAPDVIPPEIFSLPVDLFSPGISKSAEPKLNFAAASIRVWPVSLIVVANLAIPAAITAQALQVEPILEGDVWTWSSQATNGQQTIEYVLRADRDGIVINWSMIVSISDVQNNFELVDFELFTARTSIDGQQGTWQLFYPISGTSTQILNAEYAIISDTERSITFTIPEEALANGGDSVFYSENGDDRIFEWRQRAAEIVHLITWNSITRAGSITSSNYNGGQRSCWDSTLEDVVCPAS